ncbi:MAG: hypothetical protein PSW75_04255, partial [bacterium]|nr:hypothetical protein [bacterium]
MINFGQCRADCHGDSRALKAGEVSRYLQRELRLPEVGVDLPAGGQVGFHNSAGRHRDLGRLLRERQAVLPIPLAHDGVNECLV